MELHENSIIIIITIISSSSIIITITIISRLYAGYLQLYTWNKPRF